MEEKEKKKIKCYDSINAELDNLNDFYEELFIDEILDTPKKEKLEGIKTIFNKE